MEQEEREAIYAATLVVCSIDGDLDPREESFLARVGAELGVGQDRAQDLRTQLRGGRLTIVPPRADAGRQLLLQTVTRAAALDGELSSREKQLLASLAARLSVASGEVVLEQQTTPLGEAMAQDLQEILRALRGPRPFRALLHTGSTSLFLVAMNLWTIVAVLFFGWDVFFVVFTYWAENVIIGLFNFLKMLVAQGLGSGQETPLAANLAKVFLLPFFCFHYGMFCFVHGVFIVFLFRIQWAGRSVVGEREIRGALEGIFTPAVMAAIVFILLAHGYSFVRDYLGRGEYRKTSVVAQMMAPYVRVVVVHVSILFGGMLCLYLPRLFCLILVPLKTLLDLRQHEKERRRYVVR